MARCGAVGNVTVEGRDVPAAVAVVGRGRVGRTLEPALRRIGVDAQLVASRDADALAAALGRCDLVMLCVPDREIEPAAERMLAAGGPARPATVHLSGALEIRALARLRDAGFAVGGFHPFLPFPAVRPPEVLHGATIGLQASDAVLERGLTALAVALGALPRVVAPGGRVLYHAAAVMASAYLVVLAAQAVELLGAVGFEPSEALDTLLPLMAGTVENLRIDRLPAALTGPLRRGDTEIVAQHLRALADLDAPLPARTYAVLAEGATEVARGVGLSEADAARVLAMLSPRLE